MYTVYKLEVLSTSHHYKYAIKIVLYCSLCTFPNYQIICLCFGTGYYPEGFQTITSYCPEPISNVRRCWLVMPLGAGVLRWVLAWCTIEKKTVAHFLH